MTEAQRIADRLIEAIKKASAKGPKQVFADAVASGLIHEDGRLNRDYDGLSAQAPAHAEETKRL